MRNLPTPMRFSVALSFSGEDRSRVEPIADALAATLGNEKVLYDKWHVAEFARPNLDIYLPELYHESSLLLVFFFSKSYPGREWCGLEWRAGRDLLKRHEDERLMLVRFDDVTIPGLFSIDGYLDAKTLKPSDVANQILKRLSLAVPLTEKVDQWVQTLRDRTRDELNERCGRIRVLTMEQPIRLSGIYTEVNILTRRTANLRKTREELIEEVKKLHKKQNEERSDGSEIENTFDRFGIADVREDRVPWYTVFEKDHHIMVYGKPGSGKTTFVKRLATECIDGHFRADLVPVFVTLKDFSDDADCTLSEYVRKQWRTNKDCHVVLRRGRALVLLDGLDEVRDRDFSRVRKAIEVFTAEFHRSTIVLTCRIAAREYAFEQFREVEIADFSDQQISTFATRWFGLYGESDRANLFLTRLRKNRPIFELASSPLLLTLLCLVFQERLDFNGTRAELYGEGIEILLRKWDAKRGIERDRPYGLSVTDLETLLGDVAYKRFRNSDYFFDTASLAVQIEEFVMARDLLKPREEFLAGRVLSSIEAHLGLLVERASNVYSFSHLTFQEYFTAWRVAKKPSLLAEIGPTIGDARWKEVWLLLVDMFDADDVVGQIKRRVDALLAKEVGLQARLNANAKLAECDKRVSTARAGRALYFCLGLTLDRSNDMRLAEALVLRLDADFDLYYALTNQPREGASIGLGTDLASVLSFMGDLHLFRAISREFDEMSDLARDLTLAISSAAPELRLDLRALKSALPMKDRSTFNEWRRRLRKVTVQHRQLGHEPLSSEQGHVLRQYARANMLLLQCINFARTLTNDVRRRIEETMLLPSDEGDSVNIFGL